MFRSLDSARFLTYERLLRKTVLPTIADKEVDLEQSLRWRVSFDVSRISSCYRELPEAVGRPKQKLVQSRKSLEMDNKATHINIPTMEFLRDRLAFHMRSERKWLRDFLGEFLGTAFLVALGDGAVAQTVLSRGKGGEFFSITFAFAMAITFGVYISGNTSGGHINPAVTMVMVLLGRTTWRMLLVYWLAQYIGGVVGAAVVYGVYYDALNQFDGGTRQVYGENATAGIFATYPKHFVSNGNGWVDQITGTAVLTMCVFAVTDPRNVEVPSYFLPLLVGLVVGMIGLAFGFNCGFALNPARDLGPRMFTAFAGWGLDVFRFRNYSWFVVPIFAPHIGAVMGTIIYMVFVGIHWPATFDPTARERHDSIRSYASGRHPTTFEPPHLAPSLKTPDLTVDDATAISRRRLSRELRE